MQPKTETITRKQIAEGIHFTAVADRVFKTARLSVNFLMPLDGQNKANTAAGAVLPYLLCRGEDFTENTRRLDSLYGAQLTPGVGKMGENQLLSVTLETIKARYASGLNPVTEGAKMLCDLVTALPAKTGGFKQTDVESEKENVRGLLLAQVSDKREHAQNRAVEIMYKDKPYGINRYGTAEDLEALTGEDIYARWQTLMSSARIEIMYVGEGDEETLFALFAAAFANISRQPCADNKDSDRRPSALGEEITETMDVTQAKLIMGFFHPVNVYNGNAAHGNAAGGSLAAIELMNCLFGVSPTSKLFMNVREKLSLCYYCQSSYNKYMGCLYIDSGVLPENVEKAKSEIRTQLDAVAAGDFSEDELEQAKLYLNNLYAGMKGTPSGLERYWLSQIVSGSFKSVEENCAEINAVTAEQVKAAAAGCEYALCYLLTAGEKPE